MPLLAHNRLEITFIFFVFQASSLVKECMEYLDHIKNKNSPTCACLSTLKAFEERFKDFSPQHFQDKSSALLERHPDGIWMWNAVWAQCRDIRQRLMEILHASYRNQKPLGTPQKESAASRQDEAHLKGPTQRVISTSLGENESDPQTNPVGSHMKTQNSHDNETVMHFQPVRRDRSSVGPNCDLIMTGNTDKESAQIELPGQTFQLKEEGRSQHFHQSDSNVSTLHHGPMKKLRKYPRIYSHSDSDLRKSGQVNKDDCFPPYKALVRSHSEGSGLRSTSYHVSMSKTNAAIKDKVHVHKQTSAASCTESFLVIVSDRGSWDEQSSRLSHHDSFCSSASGLSQSDINEKFSSDTKSDDSTLISPATRSDNSVQTQDASICRPVRMLDNSSTVL